MADCLCNCHDPETWAVFGIPPCANCDECRRALEEEARIIKRLEETEARIRAVWDGPNG